MAGQYGKVKGPASFAQSSLQNWLRPLLPIHHSETLPNPSSFTLFLGIIPEIIVNELSAQKSPSQSLESRGSDPRQWSSFTQRKESWLEGRDSWAVNIDINYVSIKTDEIHNKILQTNFSNTLKGLNTMTKQEFIPGVQGWPNI